MLLQVRRRDEAADLLETALSVMVSRGATGQQAVIHVLLADAADAAGDARGAQEHLSVALGIYERLGGAEAADVRQRLTRSQPGDSSHGARSEQAQALS